MENRQQRRARERREAKARARAGGPARLAVTDTGRADSGAAGKMPAKVPGQHRWIVTTAYTVTAEMLRAEMEGGDGDHVILDHESRVSLAVGCADCERIATSELLDKPCEAKPEEWWQG